MSSFISVVIPVHNTEKWIERCVSSIIEQTYQNVEILLIEGGSIDQSAAICDQLAGKFDNVKVIHQENRGVSHSRNTGIKLAKGDYITFVDSDDYLQKDMLSVLCSCLEKKNADVAGCGFAMSSATERKEVITTKEITESRTVLTGLDYIWQWIPKNDIHCWAKLYRKSLFEHIAFMEDMSIGEDMLFVLEAMKIADKVVMLPEYQGYTYYLNPNGAMLKPFTPKAMDQISCWEVAKSSMEGWYQQNMSTIDEAILQQYTSIQRYIGKTLLIAIMLTAGRIACAKREERSENQRYFAVCVQKMRTYYTRESFQMLDRSYQIKVMVFRHFPNLYRKLYATFKGR